MGMPPRASYCVPYLPLAKLLQRTLLNVCPRQGVCQRWMDRWWPDFCTSLAPSHPYACKAFSPSIAIQKMLLGSHCELRYCQNNEEQKGAVLHLPLCLWIYSTRAADRPSSIIHYTDTPKEMITETTHLLNAYCILHKALLYVILLKSHSNLGERRLYLCFTRRHMTFRDDFTPCHPGNQWWDQYMGSSVGFNFYSQYQNTLILFLQ